MRYKITDILSGVAIFVLIITSIATIYAMYEIQVLSEKETHPNLIISHINQELTYSNSSSGFFDILLIKPSITVYNTKRSDYPARIFSVKCKILDVETGNVVVDNKHSIILGAGNTVIDSGENINFYTQIQMKLNKTGNYTTQTTIEYVDLKDYSLRDIDFYNQFEIKERRRGNQTLYRAKLKEVGDFDELWAIK